MGFHTNPASIGHSRVIEASRGGPICPEAGLSGPMRPCKSGPGMDKALRPTGTTLATLEATQGQIDGFFSQLPYTCHQNRVASVGDLTSDLPLGYLQGGVSYHAKETSRSEILRSEFAWVCR